jgi:hypothetical protein
MTIGKYEEEIAKQSQNMIELDLKPFLDKIRDLNNHLLYEQQNMKTGGAAVQR